MQLARRWPHQLLESRLDRVFFFFFPLGSPRPESPEKGAAAGGRGGQFVAAKRLSTAAQMRDRVASSVSCGLPARERKRAVCRRRRTSRAAAEAVGPARVQRTRLVRVPVCACVRNEAKFLTYLGERVRETASSSSLQSPSNRLPPLFSLHPFRCAHLGEEKKKKKR